MDASKHVICSKIRFLRGLFLAAALVLFNAALADATPEDFTTLSLEELGAIQVPTVIGASKHEQEVTEAPSAVNIVTRRDIQQNGYRTLADILRAERGFYVTYDGGYSYVGVRGFNRPGDFGGRILLMVDGHRMNDSIYDSAAVDADFVLDVDLIDRVEIIRGPGSTLYGNNAFFGIINVVTRRGADVGGEVSGSIGSYDAYVGRISYGTRLSNGVEFAVSASDFESGGQKRLRFPEFVARNSDASAAPSAFASISYKDFSLQGGYVDREKDWPTVPYGSIPNSHDPNFATTDERSFVELKFQHQFESGWEAVARGYFDRFQYDGIYPLAGPVPGFVFVNREAALAHSVGTEVTVSRTFFEKHRLTAGTEWRHDIELHEESYIVAPPISYIDSHETADSVGVYVQDEFSIRTNLILNAGARYDHFTSFGETANPRLALIYTPWRHSTFKLLYGQAYRAPNAFERYSQSPEKLPNPTLDAEKIKSYELIYEQLLGAHWRFSASAFWNDIDDLIDLRTIPGADPGPADDMYQFANLTSVQARGLECEVERQWSFGLRALASYTFSNVEDTESGKALSNSPEHLAKLRLSLPIWREKVFAALELQGMSSRTTVGGSESGDFCVANFTLFSRELVKGVDFSVSIYNLFDTHYRDPVPDVFNYQGPRSGRPIVLDTVEQDGRMFRAKLTYRF